MRRRQRVNCGAMQCGAEEFDYRGNYGADGPSGGGEVEVVVRVGGLRKCRLAACPKSVHFSNHVGILWVKMALVEVASELLSLLRGLIS